MDLGEVLIPAIYPFSWKSQDEAAWLGRITEWSADDEGREYPSGQKILLVDGEEVPFERSARLTFFSQRPLPSHRPARNKKTEHARDPKFLWHFRS